jgi:hypothetical protein
MKWIKKSIDWVLQRTIGEPWDEIPFAINVGWYANLYKEREIAREVVTQGDLDIIAKHLFRRSYFEKTGEWATKHTLAEFNAALAKRMREYDFDCDIVYHRLPISGEGETDDHLDKSTIKYRAEYRDLTIISDSALHEVMAI